jgi:hypothetical protein
MGVFQPGVHEPRQGDGTLGIHRLARQPVQAQLRGDLLAFSRLRCLLAPIGKERSLRASLPSSRSCRFS